MSTRRYTSAAQACEQARSAAHRLLSNDVAVSLQSRMLSHLSAAGLGRLSCSQSAMQQLVQGTPLTVWQTAAQQRLGPAPDMNHSTIPAIYEALHKHADAQRSLQAGRAEAIHELILPNCGAPEGKTHATGGCPGTHTASNQLLTRTAEDGTAIQRSWPDMAGSKTQNRFTYAVHLRHGPRDTALCLVRLCCHCARSNGN